MVKAEKEVPGSDPDSLFLGGVRARILLNFKVDSVENVLQGIWVPNKFRGRYYFKSIIYPPPAPPRPLICLNYL